MKIKNFRWWIAGLLALVTAINYMDRQNFPVVYAEINKFIAISDSQFGVLNGLFLFAYGTMYAIGGRIVDKLGTKLGYLVIVVWWSLANMMHGFATTITGLAIGRFLLGVGEGGAFPASAKAVSEWFPAHERSFAFGIFNTGSSLGAVVAPPLILIIIDLFHSWKWTFFIFGAVGLIWTVFWAVFYSLPSKNRFVTKQEQVYLGLQKPTKPIEDDGGSKNVPWLGLLKIREVRGLLIIKFIPESAWYFFIFWLPKYLNDVLELDIRGIGSSAWVPYAFAGVGSLLGGWLSSFLIKKGMSLDKSRKISLGIAAFLLPASLFITFAPSLYLAIFFFGIAMLGHQFWSTIVQTLVADMFPSKVVGSISGLMGCVATYGAMLFSFVIGFVIERFGYAPAFLICGIMHPISFLLIFRIIKKIAFVNIDDRIRKSDAL